MYFFFVFLPSAEVHAEGWNTNKNYKLKERIKTRIIHRRTD
jgi:hypothetical protein